MSSYSFQALDLAAIYADLPYAVRIDRDTCDGKECIMAYNPELPGCMAQGWSPDEAIANLREAREDYIGSMIESKLTIPIPETYTHVQVRPENTFLVDYTIYHTVSVRLQESFNISANPLLEENYCPA